MDFVTHALIAVGGARLLVREQKAIPQLMPVALIGALLPDFDSWLALNGLDLYGRYHRVVTHTFWALIIIGLIAATAGWLMANSPKLSRFGWFVSANQQLSSPRLPFGFFAAAGLWATGSHWIGDWITGFGNLQPFWPWSTYDPSLRAVQSFDPIIFALTLIWHFAIRLGPQWNSRWVRGNEISSAGLWLGLVSIYVIYRSIFLPPTSI